MRGFHPLTIVVVLALLCAGALAALVTEDPIFGGGALVLGLIIALSVRVAKQWQKAVVLRLGRFSSLKGPGLFAIIPFADTVVMWIDTRTIATPFNAEQTLTKDTVPMDVDAVLFWKVSDAEKAALEVEYYQEAVFWAAQTALRDVIGKTMLAEMLAGREQIDELLRSVIDRRTAPWGIHVTAVEVRDINIPAGLQDAMSMQAQAERERQARVILADSERQIAAKFRESALSYEDSPTALHLRAMNILLEGMRHNSTIVVVPSSAVDTMGSLNSAMGIVGMAEQQTAARAAVKGTLPSGGAGPVT